MPVVWTACISGVPTSGLPNTISSVGRSAIPTAAAPAEWLMRAITVIPRAVSSATSRAAVSCGSCLLARIVSPGRGVSTVMSHP
jgi:hypothetical protein